MLILLIKSCVFYDSMIFAAKLQKKELPPNINAKKCKKN